MPIPALMCCLDYPLVRATFAPIDKSGARQLAVVDRKEGITHRVANDERYVRVDAQAAVEAGDLDRTMIPEFVLTRSHPHDPKTQS